MSRELMEWQSELMLLLAEGARDLEKEDLLASLMSVISSFIATGFRPSDVQIEETISILATNILAACHVAESDVPLATLAHIPDA